MQVVHIMPLNEDGEHEEKPECNCQPKEVTGKGFIVLVHNASSGLDYCKVILQKQEWAGTQFNHL